MNKQIAKLLAATVLSVLVVSALGCSEIEWADVIKFNGITYYSDLRSDNVSESDLSPYLRTTQKLSGHVHNPGYKIRNGDAAFLEPNTMVYSIAGYDPSSRLAAKREGNWYIYEASDGSRTSPPAPSSKGEAP